MEKPACELLTRLLDAILEYEPDLPQHIFNLLMDIAKYLRQECQRERALENPPSLA